MRFRRLQRFLWPLTNLLLIAAYFYYASWTWSPAGQPALEAAPGDAFIWISTAFPVLGSCLIANLFWGARLFKRVKTSGRRGPLILWAVIMICWGCAFVYDRSRQPIADTEQTGSFLSPLAIEVA